MSTGADSSQRSLTIHALRSFILPTVLALALSACVQGEVAGTTADATTADATNADATTADATTADTATVATTLAGVEAAAWASDVGIAVGEDSFVFTSDGIPDHELPDEYAIPQGLPGEGDPTLLATPSGEVVTETPLEIEIPLHPALADEPTQTSLGTIGVVISGAQLFNDYEDMELSVVAIDDQMTIDGADFLDACNGHPLATGGDYHYHGVPYCITDVLDQDGEHSSVLGFLLDGFPFYGPQDEGGEIITDDQLDDCSGHVGATPEFPEGIYHYHLTEDEAPYSVDCLSGVVEMTAQTGGGPPGGGNGPPPGEGTPQAEG